MPEENGREMLIPTCLKSKVRMYEKMRCFHGAADI
jgi:hypothetical protein